MAFWKRQRARSFFRGNLFPAYPTNKRHEFRTNVQAVFQDPFAVFNPFYKVDHIIEEPIKNYKLAESKEQAREMTNDALTRVGLRPEETLGRFPHQLSGGQRQRLVVARALLMQPKLIVADEPVSMVDASLRATILETLHKLKTDFGITILYITHDLTTAYHVSDHIIILYRGSVMEAGEVDSVIANPKHPYTQLLIDSIPWPDLSRNGASRRSSAPMMTHRRPRSMAVSLPDVVPMSWTCARPAARRSSESASSESLLVSSIRTQQCCLASNWAICLRRLIRQTRRRRRAVMTLPPMAVT